MYQLEIIITIAIILSFFIIPGFVIHAEYMYKAAKKIGAVLICYIIGVIIGNIGIFPTVSAGYDEILKGLGTSFIPLDSIKEMFESGEILRIYISYIVCANTYFYFRNLKSGYTCI